MPYALQIGGIDMTEENGKSDGGRQPLREGYQPSKKGYQPNQGNLDTGNPPGGGQSGGESSGEAGSCNEQSGSEGDNS